LGRKHAPIRMARPTGMNPFDKMKTLSPEQLKALNFVFGGGLGDAWNFVKVLNFDKVEITRNPTPQSMTITKQKK
jgi:hypothetical protein